MTPKEAIITCQIACDDCKRNHFFVSCIEERCANYIKIKALEKQLPKKPITDSTRYAGLEDFFCPSCKKRIISKLDGKWRAGILQKCCGECGQALDWSDT